jgi:glycosyltransferase involved in cell wall biosynthesis
MKVAVLGDYPRDPARIGGGVEAVLVCTMQHMHRFAGLELHVVTLSTEVRQVETVRHSGVTVYYVPASYRFANLTFFAINKLRLRRVLRQIRPDLVHAHIAGPYAQVACSLGLPAIVTPHGIRYREARLKRGWVNRFVRYPLWRHEEQAALRVAPHLISISPYIEQEFASAIRGHVYRIEVPIEDAFFDVVAAPLPQRILFVGHLTPRKGALELLQALPPLQQRFPHLEVHFAGKAVPEADPDYFPALERFVREHGLERQVSFLGQLPQDALLREYAECALLALPSYQETAPSVIEQAMAARRPVVSTRVGGIPYLVAHGETGLLVNAGDVAGLTEALARLLADEELRARMGERGRQEAEARFRADVVARQTYEVYQRVFSESRSRLKMAALELPQS